MTSLRRKLAIQPLRARRRSASSSYCTRVDEPRIVVPAASCWRRSASLPRHWHNRQIEGHADRAKPNKRWLRPIGCLPLTALGLDFSGLPVPWPGTGERQCRRLTRRQRRRAAAGPAPAGRKTSGVARRHPVRPRRPAASVPSFTNTEVRPCRSPGAKSLRSSSCNISRLSA